MKKNVGTIDRVIRGLLGIGGIATYVLGLLSGTLGVVALVVGIVLLGTAAIGWCPPYALLGINSCGARSAS